MRKLPNKGNTMSGNLAYIDELGVGSDDSTNDELLDNTDTDETQDGLNDSDDDATLPDAEEVKTDDKKSEEVDKIALLEKRIADKDKYINELREQSKQAELKKQNDTHEEDVDEEDFWTDPDKTIKELKQTMKIQQMQIQETVYANTVEDYWKTVNPTVLQEAVALDKEFAQEFNKSNQPYRTAYEYLKQRAEKKTTSEKSLRDEIRAELMKELNVKTKKEVPPNLNNSGGKTSRGNDAATDGFSSVFGSEY